MAVRKTLRAFYRRFRLKQYLDTKMKLDRLKTSRMSLEMMIMIALARFRIAVPVHRPNILVGVAW